MRKRFFKISIVKTGKTLLITSLILLTCATNLFAQQKEQTLHELNSLLINTVMDDLFTPPVSSRIYVYPNIAFYECIRNEDASFESLAGKLTDLKKLPVASGTKVNYFIAASVSFSHVAQSLVGSEYKFEDWRDSFIDSLKKIVDTSVVKSSANYGRLMADSIISWSKKDNYLISKGMSRYKLLNEPGTWQPTPNDYASALEPNWYILRPLALKSCSQFSPKKKLTYDPSKNSEFYKNVEEVYKIGKEADSSKNSIAWYWDDNPNISIQEGHLTYFVHKISPGGHWLMIAKQACIQKNAPVVKASLAYTLTSIALFDGFIACWDEKFKTNLIRPVTIINQLIDEHWQPLIQTPPFPEFTSGHAVISNAASTVLTGILGDNYSFIDSTEIPFGIMPRSFNSFNEAAEESAWSRVYGGIHYPETARLSIEQGRKIGSYVIETLYSKGNKK